ncbi:MAG TPA: hypothetical protein VGG24_12305 [Paraburkholderia sp.]
MARSAAMSRRLPGTPSSLEIVLKNCLGGMYGFGESARPPAFFVAGFGASRVKKVVGYYMARR